MEKELKSELNPEGLGQWEQRTQYIQPAQCMQQQQQKKAALIPVRLTCRVFPPYSNPLTKAEKKQQTKSISVSLAHVPINHQV